MRVDRKQTKDGLRNLPLRAFCPGIHSRQAHQFMQAPRVASQPGRFYFLGKAQLLLID